MKFLNCVQTAINYKNLNLSVPFFCQKLLAGFANDDVQIGETVFVFFAFGSIILFTVDACVGGNMFSCAWGLWIEYTVRMRIRMCVCVCAWAYAVLHGSCVYAALMSGWCSSIGVGWTWENVKQLVRRPTPPPASHTHTHRHTQAAPKAPQVQFSSKQISFI